ncbi:hypothetical protein BGW80DRAFT_1448450 [Lactifluus volemus]|nr:hypothetical protein BGW80DRAFT_1448450 [Lactifluus volemus]
MTIDTEVFQLSALFRTPTRNHDSSLGLLVAPARDESSHANSPGHPSDVVAPDFHEMAKRGGLYPGAKPMNYVQFGVVERRLLRPARRVRCTDGIRCRAPRSSDASGRRYYVITLRTSPEICVKGCESILTERKQDMVVLVTVLQPSLHELRNTMESWASQVATTINEWRLFDCQWLENPPLLPNIITPSRSQLLPSVHKNKKSDI